MAARRHDCPLWCTTDHSTDDLADHDGRRRVIQAQSDAVSASVGLVAFRDPLGTPPPPPMVSLQLQSTELDDKNSIELRPNEARRLAALLVDAAERADSGDDGYVDLVTPAAYGTRQIGGQARQRARS
jgi:hypothetical protein